MSGEQTIVAHVHKRSDPPLFDGETQRHLSHFATCPDAAEHRKTKATA